jgi:excisionase family DNA binding protein
VNLKTAARRLGVHYQTAYRWVRSGQLVAVKVGAGYEISDAALARFEAQRSALERLPDQPHFQVGHPVTPTREYALAVLDSMVDAVTTNATSVAERAARLAADVLGDAVIVALRDHNGELRVAQVAHQDPVSEVAVATVAREVPFVLELSRVVVGSAAPMFVPQVPQRDVRRGMQPELHEYLLGGGCYSLIAVPIGTDERVDGALLVVRDGPGRPYEREDVAYVASLGTRVSLAHARAAHAFVAKQARRRMVESVARLTPDNARADALSPSTFNDLLDTIAPEDPQALIAVLDLGLHHLACTKEYAALFGMDPTSVMSLSLGALVDDPRLLDSRFDELLVGELDFRTVDVHPAELSSPLTLHAAMIRGVDATPWCIVIVANSVPQLPPPLAAERSPRSMPFPVPTAAV